jgi:hypothetical protein
MNVIKNNTIISTNIKGNIAFVICSILIFAIGQATNKPLREGWLTINQHA